MDLTIDVDSYKLNVRAGVVIIHNNKILVHKNINSNHYALLGGRVVIGESSDETVKREVSGTITWKRNRHHRLHCNNRKLFRIKTIKIS